MVLRCAPASYLSPHLLITLQAPISLPLSLPSSSVFPRTPLPPSSTNYDLLAIFPELFPFALPCKVVSAFGSSLPAPGITPSAYPPPVSSYSQYGPQVCSGILSVSAPVDHTSSSVFSSAFLAFFFRIPRSPIPPSSTNSDLLVTFPELFPSLFLLNLVRWSPPPDHHYLLRVSHPLLILSLYPRTHSMVLRCAPEFYLSPHLLITLLLRSLTFCSSVY